MSAVVTCRNCGEDFAADDGGCPGCGHPRVEARGFPVGPTCRGCGAQRVTLTGDRPLGPSEPCVSCGAVPAVDEAAAHGDTWGKSSRAVVASGQRCWWPAGFKAMSPAERAEALERGWWRDGEGHIVTADGRVMREPEPSPELSSRS